jgi:hypothetical protein
MRAPALTLLALAACGGTQPAPPAPAPVAAEAPAPRQPVPGEPFVVEPGEEPRYQLRYRVPSGTRRSAEMVMDMAMDLAGTQVVTPTMIMTGPIDVTEVGRDGTVTAVWTVDDTDVRPTPGANPAMLDPMRTELEKLEHMVFQTRFSERGQIHGVEVLTKPPTAELEETFRDVSGNTKDMVTAVPVEAVGRGARWTIDDEMTSKGVAFDVHTEMEVVAVSETTVTLRGVIEMSAARQTIDVQGTPVPIEASGRGQSEVTIDFTTYQSTVSSSVAISMQMDVGTGQPMVMDIAMGIRMTTR